MTCDFTEETHMYEAPEKHVFQAEVIELVQLKLNIGTSVEDSTPTEAGIRNPTYRSGGLMN